VGNIELRANGCYVIAPPSVHPISGQPYKVHSRTPIQRVDDLRMLTEWIRGLGKSDCPQPLPRYEVKSPSGWARAALSAECAAVRTAPSGQRNATLNRAAFKMGQLVADHKLSLSEVEQQLKAAADALVGADGENTVIRTIRSGLEAGLNNPRGI
jgi:hypothetical protein